MDETESTASNFVPKDLIEIICILQTRRQKSVIRIKLYERAGTFYTKVDSPWKEELFYSRP